MSSVNTTLSLFPNTNKTHQNTKLSSSVHRNKKKRVKHVNALFVSNNAISRSVKGKLMPGFLVECLPDSDLFRMLTRANLHPFLTYPTKRVLPNLVAEFYANLTLNPGINGTVYLTSVVSGIPCLIDQETFENALNLHPTLTAFDPVDITKNFIFDRDEYKNFLSAFCNVEIPPNLYNNDRGIRSDHFTPMYQNLIQFVKEDFFPSTEKLLSFLEMDLHVAPTYETEPPRATELMVNISYQKFRSMTADIDSLKDDYAAMKTMVDVLVDNYDKVVSKLEIMKRYASSTMTRMTLLENSLAQLLQLQINIHSNSPPSEALLGLPMSAAIPRQNEVIEIKDNDMNENVETVVVKTELVEGLDKDMVDAVINNYHYNELD
ncbi:hypothetical protein POM88_000526 [Heracleum sosnowskyi]|uniref:Uncharacterized protein n=1 Tax=Heracleum sosnowskyi TaxID=360622 RepID=A0AAD8N9U4_9APIA|nr:hypothetical protein POM88_000526 [Heracleum sosnowskyi]